MFIIQSAFFYSGQLHPFSACFQTEVAPIPVVDLALRSTCIVFVCDVGKRDTKSEFGFGFGGWNL